MKTTIQYLRHTPETSDGFYHAACPLLYAEHDTITTLDDCPFPLVTDSFRVLLWGTSKSQPDDLAKGYGHSKRFAVVEYEKTCGHTVQERISFAEGVKTFDHYGTTFEGASYSVNDWQRRIEFFRTIVLCDVCQLVQHSLWCYAGGDIVSNSRKRLLSSIRNLLDYNFANWQDFTPWAEIERRAAATKYGSRVVAP